MNGQAYNRKETKGEFSWNGFQRGKIGGAIQFSTNVDRLKLQQMLL